MKLSICFICDEYPPIDHGGIGTAVKLLAEELAKSHDIFVVGISPKSFGGKNFEKKNGVNIWRFKHGIKLPFLGKNSLLKKLLNKLFKIDYWGAKKAWVSHKNFIEKLDLQYKLDVLECPDFRFVFTYLSNSNNLRIWPNISGLKVAKLHGSINFFRLENNLSLAKKEYLFEKQLFDYSDKIISVSPYTTRKIKSYYNIENSKIETIFNGLNIINTNSDAKTRKNKVIFSGSLVKKKGIIELLKAWNLVCKDDNNSVLLVYGKGVKWKYLKYIDRDITNRVFFKGHVDRDFLLNEYKTASLAVFPSHSETFGLGPIESMMMGCPTIGSKIFKKTWYFNNPKPNAMLIQDQFDTKSFANLILSVLKNDKIKNELSNEGKTYVNNHFDIVNIANKHIEFYLESIRND